MPQALRLFPRPLGPHCGPCPLREACGAERTLNACAPKLDFQRSGPFHLHPLHVDFDRQFDLVGGVAFDDIVGRVLPPLPLGALLPQARWRKRIRDERLIGGEFPYVAVRLRDVFRGGRIRTAAELRAKLGLDADAAVVLLLHGKDDLLEDFAAAERAREVADGGYALVTPPSFSLWGPRRRPNNLLSLRRSFISYRELLDAGVSACPRVGWVEPRDAERIAVWVNKNAIRLVSLDLMTYSNRSFARVAALLARFDELTSRHVHYVIDGVASLQRIAILYLAAAPERVTVSSAVMAAPKSTFEGAETFAARIEFMRRRCAAAKQAVAAADASSVEEFVARALDSRCEQTSAIAA